MSEGEKTTIPVNSDNGNKPASEPVARAANEEKKLSNKELKELKKKEKAAKRAAKKEASGISIEKQQQQAQLKKEKKQHQREQQQAQASKKNKDQKPAHLTKKSNLFGHLETTDERRASLLAVTSAISSSRASRITAAGITLPIFSSAPSVPHPSVNASQPSSSSSTSSSSQSHTTTTTLKENSVVELAQYLASMAIDDESSLVPGTSSIIPQTISESFSQPQLSSSVKELIANRDLLHPAITQLTSDIASYKIVGSIPRCLAMLETFRTIINDYKTPAGTTMSRNLTNYLSHQIDFLKKARPLSVTMGNAIRWLKQEISLIDINTPDAKAKDDLSDLISQFMREKIEFADKLILENASHHIDNGSTILTYGCSKVICDLFIHNATVLKKDFQIIIVDSRPLFEGRKMTDLLRSRGLNVMYVLITSLGTVFNMDIDYVFLGAHSILSNGFLYSRVGTALLAMSAKRRNIPVLVCCESLKFSQRVQLDSVTSNELADPNDLVIIDSNNPVKRRSNKGFLLQQFIKEREQQSAPSSQDQKQKNKAAALPRVESTKEEEKPILADWQKSPKLNILNIMYDLTPPEYIKKVITEFGALPPSSVPVILREYKGSA